MSSELVVYYDGHCPLCSRYARFQRALELGVKLMVVNLREADPTALQELRDADLQLEAGVIIKLSGESRPVFLQGATAMGLLSSLDGRASFFALGLRLMRYPRLARAIFPVFKIARIVSLILLRRDASF